MEKPLHPHSMSILERLAAENEGEAPEIDRLQIAFDVAPELGLLLDLLLRIDDRKIQFLRPSEIANLFQQIRDLSQETLEKGGLFQQEAQATDA